MYKLFRSILLICIALFGFLRVAAQSMPDNVCIGAVKHYFVDPNPVPGSTYIWKIDGVTQVGATINAIDITWNTPGTFLLEVQELSADGCTGPIRSGDVFVNSLPTIIVSSIEQPSCTVPTGSVLLSGLPLGQWTINPGSVTGTGSSKTISDLTPGTYNFTVTNEAGCTSEATTDIVINMGQFSISGRVKYAGLVTSGPVYAQMKYNIDNMVVILKDCQNIEIARDTTKTDGSYLFTNLVNGDYFLSTYRISPYGSLANSINSNDIIKIKRLITVQPTSTYKPYYLLAADVDNNASVNSNDVVRIKRKITNPSNNSYFTNGNWVGFDTTIQINYSSKYIDLKTISYGDYDASSSGYYGATLWTQSQTINAQVTTSLITNISITSATSGGNVTDDGGSLVTERGVCWSTSPNPTIVNNKVISGAGTGIFTSNITGLISGITYYVRAYVINSSGIAYGNELVFTTN
jgi:hypothetical protein